MSDKPWIMTYSGYQAYPFDLYTEMVHAEDIAHSLALTCRFRGHCKTFYSVAQHSVLAAALAPQGMKMFALMHDAPEAYLFDAPKPLKDRILVAKPQDDKDGDGRNGSWAYTARSYSQLSRFEDEMMSRLCRIFNFPPLTDEQKEIMKKIDSQLFRSEAEVLMPNPGEVMWEDRDSDEKAPLAIEPWTWEESEQRFLKCFRCLSLNPMADCLGQG